MAEVKLAEEKAKAECEAVKSEHEAYKLEQKSKMDAQVAKYTAQLQSLRESYNAELTNGHQLKDTIEEMEILHGHVVRRYRKGTIAATCLAALAIAVASGKIEPSSIRDDLVERATLFTETTIEHMRDTMCGPVPNGFTLPDKSFTFDAPWWAPEGSKKEWRMGDHD